MCGYVVWSDFCQSFEVSQGSRDIKGLNTRNGMSKSQKAFLGAPLCAILLITIIVKLNTIEPWMYVESMRSDSRPCSHSSFEEDLAY